MTESEYQLLQSIPNPRNFYGIDTGSLPLREQYYLYSEKRTVPNTVSRIEISNTLFDFEVVCNTNWIGGDPTRIWTYKL